MQVVAAEVEAVAAPDRLQAVAVVAVLAHAGDLVAFDQDPVGIAVAAVVVAVEPDRVLAEGAGEEVAADRRVGDRGAGGRPGFDPEVAAADAVVEDRDLARAGLDR